MSRRGIVEIGSDVIRRGFAEISKGMAESGLKCNGKEERHMRSNGIERETAVSKGNDYHS